MSLTATLSSRILQFRLGFEGGSDGVASETDKSIDYRDVDSLAHYRARSAPVELRERFSEQDWWSAPYARDRETSTWDHVALVQTYVVPFSPPGATTQREPSTYPRETSIHHRCRRAPSLCEPSMQARPLSVRTIDAGGRSAPSSEGRHQDATINTEEAAPHRAWHMRPLLNKTDRHRPTPTDTDRPTPTDTDRPTDRPTDEATRWDRAATACCLRDGVVLRTSLGQQTDRPTDRPTD